jgi:hypothetical protein
MLLVIRTPKALEIGHCALTNRICPDAVGEVKNDGKAELDKVWALPFLTAWCWPAAKAKRRRPKTSVDGVRQMMKQVRRWLPGRRLVLVGQ